MSQRIERELLLPAPPEEIWDAVVGDGWLAEQVNFDLVPGGAASFRTELEEKQGWVEEVSAPSRLAFWWASGDQPATRVQLTLTREPGGTRLRVLETRPLELLDLVGTPLPGSGGRTFGPALAAAA